MALLEFKSVSFINNSKTILKNISLSIDAGDFISIVGPSGSGKSTFLKLCAHLISPTQGEIIFKDKNMKSYDPLEVRKAIAYCFQTPCLFRETVRDNLSFPYLIRKIDIDHKRITELFLAFNLPEDIINTEVKNLSGGERQRIALIRTLLFKPEVILLDEITSALDIENASIVENIVQSLHDEGITVFWITHNLEQSKKYSNKILTIECGEIKSLEVLS